MGIITLPNFRTTADVTAMVRLKDGGLAIDWSEAAGIKAWLYSDAQKAISGRFDVSVNQEDHTLLKCDYSATKPQYLGVNRIIVQATFRGRTKTYDKAAFNFVPRTSDVPGDITIEDPVVDLEIEVSDVSSSILDEVIYAAIAATEKANEAAEQIPLQVLTEAREATAEALDAAEEARAAGIDDVEADADNNVGTPSVDATLENKKLTLHFHNIKGLTGNTPHITIGTISTLPEGSQATVTLRGTADDPIMDIGIPVGATGAQGNTGSSVDYPFELVNNLTTDDPEKGLSAAQGVVINGSISQLRQDVNKKLDAVDTTNPEWIWVFTDSEGKVIGGILADGRVEWSLGVPAPVRAYIEENNAEIISALGGKVDKVAGKGLSTNDFTDNEKAVVETSDLLETPEYIQVIIDNEGKALEGILADGTKVIAVNTRLLGELDLAGAKYTAQDSPEWLAVIVDSEGKIIAGIKKNSDLYFSSVPSSISNYVSKQVETLAAELDNVIKRNIDKESTVIQSFYRGRNNPKKKNFAFVWGSDFHGTMESLRNMYLFGEHYEEILFSLNTGDTQAASPLDPDIISPASEGIKKPILNVIGNHDNGYGADPTKAASKEWEYNRFIAPNLRRAGIVQPADLSDYPCYYYKDFEEFGIRLLVIDVYKTPKLYYSGGAQFVNQDLPCIDEKQADFIASAFYSLPDSWGIIVASHTMDERPSEVIDGSFTDPFYNDSPQLIEAGFQMNSPIISDIVTAFLNKQHLVKTYSFTGDVLRVMEDNSLSTSFNLDVDFSSRESSEFICYLQGHIHRDVIFKYGYDVLGFAVLNGGTNPNQSSFGDIARKPTGVTQDCFNVVSINREDRQVKIVRIGANSTINFTKRDFISMNY